MTSPTRYPYLPGHDPTAPPPGIFDTPYLSRASSSSSSSSSGVVPRRPPRRRPINNPRQRERQPAEPWQDTPAPAPSGRDPQGALERQLYAEWAHAPPRPEPERRHERAAHAWLATHDGILGDMPPVGVVRSTGTEPGDGDAAQNGQEGAGDREWPAENGHERHVRHASAGLGGRSATTTPTRRPVRPPVRRRASSDPFGTPASPALGTPPPSYSTAVLDRAPAYPFPHRPYNPFEDDGPPPLLRARGPATPFPRTGNPHARAPTHARTHGLATHGSAPRPAPVPVPTAARTAQRHGWDAPGTCSPEGIPLGVHDRVPGYAPGEGGGHDEEHSSSGGRRRRRSWTLKRGSSGRRRRGTVGAFVDTVLAATT